jgi:hypothetical protein
MRKLDLDFLHQRPAAPWAGRVLLVAAAAFALDLGRTAHELQQTIARQEARVARASPGAPLRAAAPEDLAAARETIRRLAAPWGGLFAALESTPTEGVALLSLAPDPQGASVLITGEAADYGAALRYVAALRRAPPLARAYLLRHESRAGAARYPLAFAIRAPWGQGP